MDSAKMAEFRFPHISDGVLETAVLAQGSLKTGFSISQLGLRHFYKCFGLGTSLSQSRLDTPYNIKL